MSIFSNLTSVTCIKFANEVFFHLNYTEAVPKRILDLMNVDGLTRENVASHLQVLTFIFKKGINLTIRWRKTCFLGG